MNLYVEFADPTALEFLLDAEHPKPGMSVEIPGGATLTYIGTPGRTSELRSGAEIAQLAITFGVGVSTSLVANWIYEKLKHRGTVLRRNKTVIEITPDGIIKLITETMEGADAGHTRTDLSS